MFKILRMAAKLKDSLKNILVPNSSALNKVFKGTIFGHVVVERIDNEKVTKTNLLEHGVYCIHYIYKNNLHRVDLMQFNKALRGMLVVYDNNIFTVQNAAYDYESGEVMVDIAYIGNHNTNYRVNVDEIYAPSNFIERFKMAKELVRLNIEIE